MYVKKGRDRLVLVFPILGIVAKFPVIRMREILKKIFRCVRDGHWKYLEYLCTEWKPESEYVFSGMLLRGIVSNRRERALWKRTHHPFLQPTPFSFLGFFNIQIYCKPYGGCCIDLWSQIQRITKEEAYNNSHQFSEPSNYCLVGRKLRILDYGGSGSARIVMKYGEKIADEFDPEFHYRSSNK